MNEKIKNLKMEGGPDPEKISPTAKFVAYLRTFSDIPFSKYISDVSDSENVFKNICGEYAETMIKFAPLLEARFKVISAIIEQEKIKNVLEMASGVSPRGLIMSQDPSVNYVEADLPNILAEKEEIVRDILDKTQQRRPNLYFAKTDVLKLEELQAATLPLNSPIAVAHEGLLNYLTREEKMVVAKNIHQLLSQKNGIWITLDISTRPEMERILSQNEKMRNILSIISGITERNMETNAFKDEEDIQTFFRETGFEAEVRLQLGTINIDDLSSVHNLNLDKEQIVKLLATRKVFILHPIYETA